MQVICFAKQLSAPFSFDASEVVMEILTLQSDFHLKAHQRSPNFWCPVETEMYKWVCAGTMKTACHFGLTYLWIYVWYKVH